MIADKLRMKMLYFPEPGVLLVHYVAGLLCQIGQGLGSIRPGEGRVLWKIGYGCKRRENAYNAIVSKGSRCREVH